MSTQDREIEPKELEVLMDSPAMDARFSTDGAEERNRAISVYTENGSITMFTSLSKADSSAHTVAALSPRQARMLSKQLENAANKAEELTY